MKKRLAVIAGTAIMAVAALSGCANDTIMDYEEGMVRQPDSVVVWNNIDGHPNVARLCIEGIAFMTTTRKGQDSITRMEEWDTKCEGDKAAASKVPSGGEDQQ